MKQLIKKLLPTKVLDAVAEMRERKRLNAVPAGNFEAARLRPARDFQSLIALFSDPATGKLWEAAHAEISRVFVVNQITWAVNPGDRRALFYLVHALQAKRVLEVGTHIGGSTLYIARALKEVAKNAKVTTVDIADVNDPLAGAWKQFGLPMSPAACAGQLCCLGQIEFRTAPSLEFMAQTKERFDLIFLDGDHSAIAVYREVSAASGLLNEGGVILLHDYYPNARALFPDGIVISGPYRAMERIRRENNAIEVYPLGALPWETKQGSHVTSLALVVRK